MLKRLRKARFFWVYPLAAWLFLIGRTSEPLLRAGVVLVLLGEAVRLWANGYVGHRKVNWTQHWRNDPKIGQLITGGPYAFVRHPLYFGTFLIGAGFCVAMGNLWLSALALAFFLLVYRRKMAEEEITLRHEGGAVFERYQRVVPRWFPTGRQYAQRHGVWSWQGILASRELKTLAWVIVLLIALYFREELLRREPLFAGGHETKRILLLALMVGLMLSDGIYELIRRIRRHRVQAVHAAS